MVISETKQPLPVKVGMTMDVAGPSTEVVDDAPFCRLVFIHVPACQRILSLRRIRVATMVGRAGMEVLFKKLWTGYLRKKAQS